MTDAAPDDGFVQRVLRAAARRPRMLTPGGAREWPDRKLAELSVAEDLAAALWDSGESILADLRPRFETKPPTPPDVLARNEEGGVVAIEVTELADQEVIAVNITRAKARLSAIDAATTHGQKCDAHLRNPLKVRIWSGPEALSTLQEIVAHKDAITLIEEGAPYAERWLLIHTAEPFVDWAAFSADLPSLAIAPKQFDRVYLLRDFDPSTGKYPVWRLFPQPGPA